MEQNKCLLGFIYQFLSHASRKARRKTKSRARMRTDLLIDKLKTVATLVFSRLYQKDKVETELTANVG